MALFGSTTTGTDNVIFSPEAIRALQQELGYFQNVERPAETGQMQQLLSILRQQGPTGARALTPGYAPLAQTLQLAPNALAHAGQARGVHTPEFGNAVDTLRSSMPQLLELLRQHALKSAGETQSLLSPTWAKLLQPDVVKSSVTEKGAGQSALEGVGTAAQLAALAAQFGAFA